MQKVQKMADPQQEKHKARESDDSRNDSDLEQNSSESNNNDGNYEESFDEEEIMAYEMETGDRKQNPNMPSDEVLLKSDKEWRSHLTPEYFKLITGQF